MLFAASVQRTLIAVVDTQVWVSGLLNDKGAAAKVIRAYEERAFTAAISEDVLLEYERVLGSFPWIRDPTAVDRLLARLVEMAAIVIPPVLPPMCRDPGDEKFVQCAVAAAADFVVTKNVKHFPRRFGGTRVVRISDFLRALGR